MSRLESLVSCGLAVSMGEAAKPILVQGVKASCNEVVMKFCVAGVALRDILMCLQTCRSSCGRRNTFASVSEDEMHFFLADTALWRPPSSFGVAGADPSCVECYF